jgi:hypothetical protein
MAIGFWEEKARRCHIPCLLFEATSIHLLDLVDLLDVACMFPRQEGRQRSEQSRLPEACLPETRGGLALIALLQPRLVGSHGVRGCLMHHLSMEHRVCTILYMWSPSASCFLATKALERVDLITNAAARDAISFRECQ